MWVSMCDMSENRGIFGQMLQIRGTDDGVLALGMIAVGYRIHGLSVASILNARMTQRVAKVKVIEAGFKAMDV